MTAFYASMSLTVITAVLAGAWLIAKSAQHKVLQPLAGFCLAMAGWCAGHLLVQFDAGGCQQVGLALLLANPFIPTFFLHFTLRFIGDTSKPQTSPALIKTMQHRITIWYWLAAVISLISWLVADDDWLQPWLSFNEFVRLEGFGWVNLAYTVLVGLEAHSLLVWGWQVSSANKRRSIVAMFIAGGWGLLLATSFVFPSVNINVFPYPMLLLPSYAVLLVYGVTRYQLVEVNHWARKAINWLALVTGLFIAIALFSAVAGSIGITAFAEVPLIQLWLYSLFVLAVAWMLSQPAHLLADRIIYPGAHLDQGTIDQWLATMQQCQSWQLLKTTAEELLQQHVGRLLRVEFVVTEKHHEPTIYCLNESDWEIKLVGWEDLTPSLRHVGEVFAALLLSSARLLEQRFQIAKQEKQRLAEQHLVELGSLSAAMAHELRNPLNIISMAAVQTDKTTRSYIQAQVARADQLVSDMLSYSGKLELNCEINKLALIISTVASYIEQNYQVKISIDIESDLAIYGDCGKIQQVLTNLLENAAAFTRNQQNPHILVSANSIQKNNRNICCEIVVHNNGPAITEEMKKQLFTPFVSKRAGGSGLGLAIIKRIMDAHDGYIYHSDSMGWNCSFICQFPFPD
ncbi:sensor histidine kinase [Spartinivicinus ruber]|uniref:sensor histidine kinase n=1 Tax=Spartinivicinus ruber TaxID=2683272 RepID=UPI0013D58CDA|nr:sensor histidine kinase [Spartinivicinus ruber]